MEPAKLSINDHQVEFPITVGTEDEVGFDILKLRSSTKAITLDPGFANTGSCESTITYIDGEKGILRYRGYTIEDLATHSTFVDVAYLLINGELPTREEFDKYNESLTHHSLLHEDMKKFF